VFPFRVYWYVILKHKFGC